MAPEPNRPPRFQNQIYGLPTLGQAMRRRPDLTQEEMQRLQIFGGRQRPGQAGSGALPPYDAGQWSPRGLDGPQQSLPPYQAGGQFGLGQPTNMGLDGGFAGIGGAHGNANLMYRPMGRRPMLRSSHSYARYTQPQTY
jgi:hypothetical protein